MTPLQRYQHDLQHNGYQSDSVQMHAVTKLDALYHQLDDYQSFKPVTVTKWKKWLGIQQETLPTAPKGLYFWGGVGRGKTYIMDTFFDTLPNERKLRLHFHRFMHRVHDELKTLSDVSDPLRIVADRLKQETDILCFDEFFVSDITDAMILGTLIEALFERGVILVATSNIPPHDLYRNGLQRARFLPAIAQIEAHCEVLNVDGGVDYRLRTLTQAEIYHSPLDALATENLLNYRQQLTGEPNLSSTSIEINHRWIEVEAECKGLLHATFAQLCESARSHNDYIEMSRLYHTVLLANVRHMSSSNDDAARRFIALVDEFYERKVKLIISAEVEMEMLYTHGQLEFEFKRCISRLTEMQSEEYLALEHLA
jgi:cell division protein ZapE